MRAEDSQVIIMRGACSKATAVGLPRQARKMKCESFLALRKSASSCTVGISTN